MKTTFLSFILISITTLLTAQELPEIPMKNGMAYYSFEHKLDNIENCLSKYFSNKYPQDLLAMHQKVSNYAYQFTTKNSGLYKSVTLNISTFNVSNTTNCIDTIKLTNGFILSKSGEILWRPAIIELLRKKTMGSEINAQIEIIFLSKNEYKLVFKGLQYKINWMQGMNPGVDIYNIGELYEQTKTIGKITNSDIKFFENLNYYMKSADEIILKALTELYKEDEL
jgi:hypothetical protein